MARPGLALTLALKAPTALYDLGLGRMFRHRFLLLTHQGRHSGLIYRTVVEVIRWDPTLREATVMAGFGRTSDWFRNVTEGHALEIQVGRERFVPQHRVLNVDAAAEVLADYERRNRMITPMTRRVLSRLAGFQYDGSTDARRRLVETLPLLTFSPRDRSE